MSAPEGKEVMNSDQLFDVIVKEFIPKIECHEGLSIFAKERSKFEGWVKVELVDTLRKHFSDVRPEKNTIDICFKDWALELKTVNTNYRFPGVQNKHRPITKNVESVIEDIQNLAKVKLINKGVVYIVFPVQADDENWMIHQQKIDKHLSKLNYHQFHFEKKIPAVLYFGVV